MTSKTNKAEVALLDEIEAEFSILESDFGDLGLEDGDDSVSSELQSFEAALAGTEFGSESAEADMGSSLTILQIADGESPGGGEEGWGFNPFSFVPNIIKRKAKKIIAKLTKLIRKYAKYRACIPAVTQAVAAFQAKKYGTALKRGYAAYRCIRAHS